MIYEIDITQLVGYSQLRHFYKNVIFHSVQIIHYVNIS